MKGGRRGGEEKDEEEGVYVCMYVAKTEQNRAGQDSLA